MDSLTLAVFFRTTTNVAICKGKAILDMHRIGLDLAKNLMNEFSSLGNMKMNHETAKPKTKGHQAAYEAAFEAE